VRTGTYEFDIGTAGSTSLLLHSLYLPLALAQGRTVLRLTGGTHVPFAPTYHYLADQWAPLLRRLGIEVELQLLRAGYYPEGGGQIRAKIRPSQGIRPLALGPRGDLERLEGVSAVSNLDRSIADRQRRRALQRLDEAGLHAGIESIELPSPGKGTLLHLLATFAGGGRACCGALGARGKRSEAVADEACDSLLDFLGTAGAIGHHAADQVILPLALADGTSRFPVSRVTSHLLTNARLIERFLPCRITIAGAPDAEGTVTVVP
jgi:RNA 3'-terminal phosphate cyclase (ATP)